ncbi:MAG: fibronectin type III domain-containing protein, partial [candidate division Zixibacteria bacterium]|nr:fibronectin type III domain-containing protein [candidate division Zixibacteria bacterium]
YDIRYSTSMINSGNWDAASQATGEPSPQTAGSSESFTVTGLNSGTLYYFALKTADEVPNWSGVSNVVSVSTSEETTPPAIVSNLGNGGATATSIMLSWTAPGDDGNSGTASQYDIRYATSTITDANWDAAVQFDGEPAPKPGGSVETVQINGLESGTTYYFALKTADEVPNWSGLSNVTSGTTMGDATAPQIVSTLTAGMPTETSITLLWIAPGDDGAVGTAAQYDVRYHTSPITLANWNMASRVIDEAAPKAAGTPETLTVTGLNSNRAYYFALMTADEVPNWSAMSNVASASTGADITPPGGIDDLNASGGEVEGTIDLSWTAPGDDGMTGTAAFYMIRYSMDSITESNWNMASIHSSPPPTLEAGNIQTATIGGLVPARQYYAAVRTYDELGNPSVLSNVAMAEATVDIISGNEDLAELQSPTSGSLLHTSQPVLVVQNVDPNGSDSYFFEVATDSGFFGLVASGETQQELGLTTSWKVPAGLSADLTYYWRVATNNDGYSDAWSFSVEPFTHAYPNPVRFAEAEGATFTDLPQGSELVLLSISGDVVKRWSNTAGTDIQWDGTNDAGSNVSSGTYLWYLADSGEKGKLVVIR